MDFIVVNGGQDESVRLANSLLISLDATSEQQARCEAPSDLIKGRKGHMLGKSNGHLVVCGGVITGGYTDTCEVFDHEQGIWVNDNVTQPHGNKNYFPSVQLDDNRIWMGRKLLQSSYYTNTLTNTSGSNLFDILIYLALP